MASLLNGLAVTEGLSWPWIFFINVPVGAVAFLVEEQRSTAPLEPAYSTPR